MITHCDTEDIDNFFFIRPLTVLLENVLKRKKRYQGFKNKLEAIKMWTDTSGIGNWVGPVAVRAL